MIAQVLLEGLILGILLMGVCAFGIRKGAVGMVQEISGQASGSCLCNGQMAVRKIYDETGDGKQSFGAYGLVLVFFRNCQKLNHYILPLLLSHNCFKIVPAFCDILHEPDVPFEDQFPVILFLINS